jgi:rubrerythrin
MSVDPEHTEQLGEVGPDEVTPDEPEQPAESPEQGEEEEASESEGESAEPQPDESEPQASGGVMLSEQDAEKMGERLAKERTRHDNRIAEIMGEAATDLVPCELCQPVMQGFHFPATAEAPNPRDELHSRLLAVLLRPTAVDIREDPNTETCPTCGGPGWLLTRGQVAGEEKWECRTCGGHGFLDNWPKSGNGTTTHPPAFDAGGDVPTFTST